MWDNGEWWMLLAAQSMAVGTVLIPWVTRYVDPVVATGWHLVLGGLPLVALSLWQELPQLQERLPMLTGGCLTITHGTFVHMRVTHAMQHTKVHRLRDTHSNAPFSYRLGCGALAVCITARVCSELWCFFLQRIQGQPHGPV